MSFSRGGCGCEHRQSSSGSIHHHCWLQTRTKTSSVRPPEHNLQSAQQQQQVCPSPLNYSKESLIIIIIITVLTVLLLLLLLPWNVSCWNTNRRVHSNPGGTPTPIYHSGHARNDENDCTPAPNDRPSRPCGINNSCCCTTILSTHCTDGFTCGYPNDRIMDCRNGYIFYKMDSRVFPIIIMMNSWRFVMLRYGMPCAVVVLAVRMVQQR